MFTNLLLYTIALYFLRSTVLVCVHKPINAIDHLMRKNKVYCMPQTRSYINLEVHEYNKTAVYNFKKGKYLNMLKTIVLTVYKFGSNIRRLSHNSRNNSSTFV